jgi:UDP-N-acetylmuramate dehydrogenase
MFKNPEGDYAGRLIEAAGLKGKRIGGAMISDKHANFFVNTSGEAQASDVKALIDLAHGEVLQRFGVDLELEIELVGEWAAERIKPKGELGGR